MPSNPFITQAQPMTGQTLVDPQSLALQRQKQYAAALLQQNQQPQGQMVSGQYVAPSWTQQLNSALNPLVGAYMMNQADTKQTQLAEALRQRGVQESQDILSTVRGREAVPEFVPQGQTLLDDQGMPTYGAKMAVAGVAPDLESAYAKSVGAMTPQGRALAPMLAKQLMPDLTPEEKRYKAAVKDGSFRGGFNDFLNQLTEKDRQTLAIERAKLADVGITVGGGMPVGGNMTMGGGQNVNQVRQVTGDAKFMPSNLPVYQYDPNLSPKQNREEAGKFSTELNKNVKNAKNTFELLKDASGILNTGNPSSGMLESMVTGTKQFFGKGGETSKADQRLNMIGGALTMTQPRFEGPQGVLDVKIYEKLAGDLGNANLPIDTRLAAVQQMIRLQKKYYPNGDWDSIDVSGPVMTKQTFLSGEKRFDPVTFRQGLNSQDQQAFDWARKNPTDPRSNEIKERLGIQ